MIRGVLPALLALCSIGCTTSGTSSSTSKADADRPSTGEDPGPDSSDTDSPEYVDPGPPIASRAPVEQLPACPSEQGDALANYCTDDGKLAGQWLPVDLLKLPGDVHIIFTALGPDHSKRSSLLIATRGDQLYIKQVTCGGCRRVLGQGFVGQPSQMSEAQLRELQTRLGLGTELPVLASTEAWASFCAGQPGEHVLTQIASKTEVEAPTSSR